MYIYKYIYHQFYSVDKQWRTTEYSKGKSCFREINPNKSQRVQQDPTSRKAYSRSHGETILSLAREQILPNVLNCLSK